jgi:hypothetical protein
MLLLRGDETETVVVKLEPLARVTGHLLDAERQPLAGLTVSLVQPREIDRELYRFAGPPGAKAVTDKDGRFTLDAVVPGVRTGVNIQRGDEHYQGDPRIVPRTLKPGETYHLGDCVVVPSR